MPLFDDQRLSWLSLCGKGLMLENLGLAHRRDTLLVPDDLSPSDFSSISESFSSPWNPDTLMRYEDWKKRSEERILHNRLSSIYKILDFWKCKNNGSLKQIFRFWGGEISRGGFCRFSIAPKTKISTYSIVTLNPISTDVIPFMGIVRVQYRGSNLISRTLNQQSG